MYLVPVAPPIKHIRLPDTTIFMYKYKGGYSLRGLDLREVKLLHGTGILKATCHPFRPINKKSTGLRDVYFDCRETPI